MIQGRQNAVSTTATQLGIRPTGQDGGAGSSFSILGTDNPFYLGGSDVTTSTGALVTAAMLPLAFDLQGGEVPYAVTATGSALVTTLQTGA